MSGKIILQNCGFKRAALMHKARIVEASDSIVSYFDCDIKFSATFTNSCPFLKLNNNNECFSFINIDMHSL